jgi:hypothetical protein
MLIAATILTHRVVRRESEETDDINDTEHSPQTTLFLIPRLRMQTDDTLALYNDALWVAFRKKQPLLIGGVILTNTPA